MQTLTQTLIQGGLLKKIKMPSYFYQKFFHHQHYSPTDTIIFDDVYDDLRGVANFVAPNVKATASQTESFTVKVFKPAYIKQLSAIEAWSDKWQSRLAGERIGGSLSPQQRERIVRASQIRKHAIKLENRIELMCFQAMAGGRVVIRGEKYPTTTVDYFRDPRLTTTTMGNKNWTQPNVNPLDIIATMSDLAYDVSEANIDTLIVGKKAWAAIYNWFNHADRRHLFDKNIRGSDAQMNLVFANEIRGVEKVMSFTSLNGIHMEIYVDNRSYINEKGDVVRFVRDGEVIGIDSLNFQSVQAFGAIKDKKAGFQSLRIFHKEYPEEDPSVDYLLSHSAPLPIVLTPNHTWRILDVTQ